VVPGNHDCYAELTPLRSLAAWTPYLRSDAAALESIQFPTLRQRGPLALVGLSSARPTSLLRATGSLGNDQCRRIEALLKVLSNTHECRVILIHHPPLGKAVASRRRLTDPTALGEVLARTGAELVLHGHLHREFLTRLPEPKRSIPVVGVRSASEGGTTCPPRSISCLRD